MGEFKLIIEPDKEEAEAASVYVDGNIGGKAYRFLLDTGAARSSVVFDDYTSTLNAVGKSNSSGVFASTSDDLITVSRVEIGPIARQNFTLTRSPVTPGTQSLIGMDLLRDTSCHFFFHDHRVSVDAGSPQEDTYVFEPLLLDGKFHPYIHVGFGDVQASAVWDTGASITIADLNFINSQPAFFAAAGQSPGTDATGTQVDTPMFIMSSATIGGYLLPPCKVAAVDLSAVNGTLEMPMDLILGYNILSKANWLFDFPGKKWAISRWLGIQ